MDPVSSQKVCVACGRDVANVKRFKDLAGSYYCEPCWNEHTAQERRAKMAPAAARKETATQTTTAEPSEEAPVTDPLLAALAGVAVAEETANQPEKSGKPIPPPRKQKGPPVWFFWTLILVGVTLLAAFVIMLILVIKGPEKQPPKPASSDASKVIQIDEPRHSLC